MKRLALFIAAIAVFALPSVASAHTASVKCDSTGVVFTYNANFPHAFIADERVNGVHYSFVIAPHVVSTHTIPGVIGTVVVSSDWGGPGSITQTTLTCPAPTPPPAAVCPSGTTDLGMSNGVKICGSEKIVYQQVIVPGPPPAPGTCPKGTKKVSFTNGVLTCKQVIHKTKVKIVKKIKYVQWCPLPPKPTPGVTG